MSLTPFPQPSLESDTRQRGVEVYALRNAFRKCMRHGECESLHWQRHIGFASLSVNDTLCNTLHCLYRLRHKGISYLRHIIPLLLQLRPPLTCTTLSVCAGESWLKRKTLEMTWASRAASPGLLGTLACVGGKARADPCKTVTAVVAARGMVAAIAVAGMGPVEVSAMTRVLTVTATSLTHAVVAPARKCRHEACLPPLAHLWHQRVNKHERPIHALAPCCQH
jgi:hypothetical protein